MWPASKLEPSTRTSTPLRGGADYLRLPASRSSIVSTAQVSVEASDRTTAFAGGRQLSAQTGAGDSDSEMHAGKRKQGRAAGRPRCSRCQDRQPRRGRAVAGFRLEGAPRRASSRAAGHAGCPGRVAFPPIQGKTSRRLCEVPYRARNRGPVLGLTPARNPGHLAANPVAAGDTERPCLAPRGVAREAALRRFSSSVPADYTGRWE